MIAEAHEGLGAGQGTTAISLLAKATSHSLECENDLSGIVPVQTSGSRRVLPRHRR